jgi:hypothetical protein
MQKKILLFISMPLLWSCNQSSSKSSSPDNTETNTSSGVADFVSFDQAYIPVLFFTSVENLDASLASYNVLEKEWDAFQSAGKQLFNDPKWDNEQIEIDLHIKEAATFITAGKDLKEAHESLEQVREILMEARHRNNIDYFVDHLTAYHEPMEQIVLTAKESSPDQWTAETTAKIQSVLPEAKALWQATLKAPFDLAKYGFNETRHEKMRQLMAAETLALEKLKQSLEEEKPVTQIRKNALDIKKHFAGLFKLFGNLEAYQKVGVQKKK